MIVGPIQAQMDDFCDLHGTPDTPVSRIVTVKVKYLVDPLMLGLVADSLPCYSKLPHLKGGSD